MIMDADGSNARKLSFEKFGWMASWSPNSKYLVVNVVGEYGQYVSDLYTINVESNQWKRLTDSSGDIKYPSWSTS